MEVQFKVGDIVFCTKTEWSNDKGISLFNPPRAGHLVIVDGVRMHKGQQLLQLRGQPLSVYYPAKHFRPQHCLFADQVIKKLTVGNYGSV